MENDGTLRKSSSRYPKTAAFPKLFAWHFNRGTRPDGSPATDGRPWSKREFADAVGVDSERAVGNWISGQSRPRHLGLLLSAFFGQGNAVYDDWYTDLRVRYQDFHARHEPSSPGSTAPIPAPRLRILRPYNFDDHGFISESHVELRGARGGARRSLHAQIDFFERLYAEDAGTKVEFGVARAILSIKVASGVRIMPNKATGASARETIRFVQRFRDSDFAVVVHPRLDAVSLGEGALPSDGNNNRLCALADLPLGASAQDLRASVHVRLNAEGIEFFGADTVIADQKIGQMLAVLKAAAGRNLVKDEGFIVHELSIDDEEIFPVATQ
jgi:hypothetical protein